VLLLLYAGKVECGGHFRPCPLTEAGKRKIGKRGKVFPRGKRSSEKKEVRDHPLPRLE